MNNICHLTDCMEFMKTLQDNAYDLAIVDPPYGGGQHFNFRYGVGDEVYESNAPAPEYFDAIFRVSRNQIIWGGNYFTYALPVNRCWISWFKGQPLPSFSDIELAWTSFDRVSRQINLQSYGFNHGDKKEGGTIHPTQKPVGLYINLLQNYAKPGQTIFDSHVGSGSIRIACHDMGYDFTGCEIDADYHAAQEKRFQTHIAQNQLFEPAELTAEYHQEKLL